MRDVALKLAEMKRFYEMFSFSSYLNNECVYLMVFILVLVIMLLGKNSYIHFLF